MTMLENLPSVNGVYRLNADLSKYCWFKVGGSADVLFKPADQADLIRFLQQYNKALPIFILGVGSNLLIKDSGFRGCVIRLGRSFNYIKHNDVYITCGAACLDISVAKYAVENNFAGLEFLSGIPGTIGGAIAMNAGAYGRDISDVLVSVKAVNKSGGERTFSLNEMGFSYSSNSIGDDWIFIEATLKATPGNSFEIERCMDEIANKRQQTQPIKSLTSGSTYRNPDGLKAWELIDAAGCRGLKVGGAEVSQMHCNFFINVGGATAQDIIDLIAIVKQKVYDNSGVLLSEEIKII